MVDYNENIGYIKNMSVDSLAWLANDTTPVFTWDDILQSGGVADQTFGVITPDPREPNPIYSGIMEVGILAVAILLVCIFFPQNK